jgi:Arc/MetJ-type ribon-helix-helix transcriptional regulator
MVFMAQKVMISMPDYFVKLLDELAAAEHRSRSELIREAVRAYAEQRAPQRTARPIDDPKARAAYERTLATREEWSDPDWDSVAVVREMREGRYGDAYWERGIRDTSYEDENDGEGDDGR